MNKQYKQIEMKVDHKQGKSEGRPTSRGRAKELLCTGELEDAPLKTAHQTLKIQICHREKMRLQGEVEENPETRSGEKAFRARK